MSQYTFEDDVAFDIENLGFCIVKNASNTITSVYQNYIDRDYFVIEHNKEDTWRHLTFDDYFINGGVGVTSFKNYLDFLLSQEK